MGPECKRSGVLWGGALICTSKDVLLYVEAGKIMDVILRKYLTNQMLAAYHPPLTFYGRS